MASSSPISPEEPASHEAPLSPAALEQKRRALMQDVQHRLAKAEGLERTGKGRSLSGIRLRTLLLPAFAIVLFLHFGSRAGAPLGVHAAFTPGDGASFAGPRVFSTDASDASPVRLEPGDVVGTTSGTPSVLELGKGRLILQPGARAAVASLMPPRVRLLGGRARAKGRLRVVAAHGLYDLHEGEALLLLDAKSGLSIEQIEGSGTVISSAGSRTLEAGESSRTQ